MANNSRFLRFCVLFSAGSLMALIAVITVGQTTPASSPASSSAKAPATTKAPATAVGPKVAAPASVQEVLTIAQMLFDAANTSDWTAAAKESTSLKDVMKKLKTDIPNPNTAQQTRLKEIATHITAIDAGIKAKGRHATIMDANRLIRVAGILADTFINKVPQSVWQLEYLAREMQVWSADPADLTKLQTLPARVDAEWLKISKEVSAKGGDALAKEFADASAKAKAAATADQFSSQTKPLLDLLAKIEKAYLK